MVFMRRRIIGVVLLASGVLALSLVPPAFAGLLPQTKPTWNYLGPESLPATLLPAPPAADSAEARKQLRDVLLAQEHVTQSDRVAMRDEEHFRLELMTQVLGSDFTLDKKPKAFALLNRVVADTKAILDTDKNFWHTQRPYLADHRIKLMLDPIDNNRGYPSGQACLTRVIAEVLGMIHPNRVGDLRAKADAIAWHRVQAGVQSPSDLEGGRLLAMQIMGSLMQNDIYLDDVSDARREAGFLY